MKEDCPRAWLFEQRSSRVGRSITNRRPHENSTLDPDHPPHVDSVQNVEVVRVKLNVNAEYRAARTDKLGNSH